METSLKFDNTILISRSVFLKGYSDSFRNISGWEWGCCIPSTADMDHFVADAVRLHPKEDPLLLRRSWRLLADFFETGWIPEMEQIPSFSRNSKKLRVPRIRMSIDPSARPEPSSPDRNCSSSSWISYLQKQGRLPFDRIPQMPHPVCRRRKVLPCMEDAETSAILAADSPSFPVAKRLMSRQHSISPFTSSEIYLFADTGLPCPSVCETVVTGMPASSILVPTLLRKAWNPFPSYALRSIPAACWYLCMIRVRLPLKSYLCRKRPGRKMSSPCLQRSATQ